VKSKDDDELSGKLGTLRLEFASENLPGIGETLFRH
jgi:hypothetical protein